MAATEDKEYKDEKDENGPAVEGPGYGKEKEKDKDKEKPKKKRVPFYLNWQLWLILSLSLMAVTVGLVITFGPVVIIAPVLVIAGIVAATAGPVIGAWEKVNEKLKEAHDRAEQAEVSALIAGRRNTEIERKADRAATTAITLSDRVDINAERSEMLETRMEVISDQAYQLTQSLQQERAESRLVTAELKAQNQRQQQEINELKEQLRLMGLEKSGDKEKIIRLEGQVKQLQDRVKELEDRESALVAENGQLIQANYELRNGPRRRASDQLPGLPPDAAEKLKQLEEENEKKRTSQGED